MAEGLFLYHLRNLSVLEKFEVDSCGTGGWHSGETADRRMLKTAEKNGITLTHRARQLKKTDMDTFDYILVMDHQNLRDVLSLYPDHAHKVKLLTEFSTHHKNQIIPDPYFGSDGDFDDVYELLNQVTLQVAHHLVQKHL